jgi:Hg(II)-responsive transcriptional regulator
MRGDRLRIGEVASRARVNIQTLRYYERRGLLEAPGRTGSGYREYPSETVRLIRFIKRAQELGFTLKEIEELIALRDAKGRRRSEVRTLAEGKMRDIDKKLAQLQAMRSALYSMVESCACRDGRPTCPIIEALDDAEDETAAAEPLVPASNHARQ